LIRRYETKKLFLSQFQLEIIRMNKTCLFDMDGLLLDSEPLWRRAEVHVFNSHGIPLTENMCDEVMGLRIDEVVTFWFNKFNKDSFDVEKVVIEIIDEVAFLIQTEGKVLPGAIELVKQASKEGWKTAIVSSSYLQLIEVFVQKFKLQTYLDGLFSAEFCQFGKPHPEVFINALEQLDGRTQFTWVFEDSIHGMVAAKSAKMRVCLIPNQYNQASKGFDLADRKYKSLIEVDLKKLEKDLAIGNE